MGLSLPKVTVDMAPAGNSVRKGCLAQMALFFSAAHSSVPFSCLSNLSLSSPAVQSSVALYTFNYSLKAISVISPMP